MTEWKEYKLGEIVTFQRGHDLPKDKMIDGDIPVAGSNGIIGYHNQFTKEGPGVTIGRSGNIGIPHYYPNAYWAHNTVLYIVDFKGNDAKFMYYLLKTFDFTQLNTGSAVPSLNRNHIHELPVSIPDVSTQRRIAAILSSLDDKIDLLHRENASLEQMAETMFRQWFVEESKEEWEEGKLGDWLIIKRGGSPRPINDYIAPQGYRWLKISDVTNLNSPYIFKTKEYIKESGLSKTVYLKKGSLVLSNSATPGIPKILCVDSCIHDGWLYFPKSSFSKIYLYLLFKYIREDLVNLGNGSIFTNLKTDILKDYKVVKPDTATLENFDHQVEPIFDKLYNNDIQIQTLIQARDGLLERLMSGEIKV